MIKTHYKKFPIDKNVVKKARFLTLAGGPTRVRILCFMFEYKKGCVFEIAESLGMSVASISNHLQKMKDNGFFTTIKDTNRVCYRLVENKFTSELKNLICGNHV